MSEDRDYPLASDIGLLFIFQILHYYRDAIAPSPATRTD